MPVPGRAVTWVSWPSTQTGPRRSIHFATLSATVRTGHGASAVVGGVRVGDRLGHDSAVSVAIRLVSIVTNGGRSRVRGLPGQQLGELVHREAAQSGPELRRSSSSRTRAGRPG